MHLVAAFQRKQIGKRQWQNGGGPINMRNPSRALVLIVGVTEASWTYPAVLGTIHIAGIDSGRLRRSPTQSQDFCLDCNNTSNFNLTGCRQRNE
ncbi:hypothetical protein Zmor_010936 [Zophobas morio]|uniref:Uncharacterized protein n=1 Tax=Zophobas morio TaxID=2755281 RepID=A0AA38ILW7_9CUCU|nr:hypothetical protein Zmor_010936 [Zophobas morio]